jgi:hypothetical protein
MSTDPTGAPGGPAGPEGAPGQPSEEELRAAYEAELSRISSADMMLQAAVSLLNIGSFKLAPRQPAAGAEGQPPERADASELEQVRDAIDGVRALLEILERRLPGGELKPLRDALSQLQMAYAREAQASGVPAGSGPQTPGPEPTEPAPGAGGGGQQGQAEAPQGQDPSGPGPAESSGRLWVPGR